MWLFTDFGFFSIVAKREDQGLLCVRARARGDLEAFAALVNLGVPPRERVKIMETPNADYGFRFVARSSLVGAVIAEQIQSIDYDNFKSKIGETDVKRERMYHDVWRVMFMALGSIVSRR